MTRCTDTINLPLTGESFALFYEVLSIFTHLQVALMLLRQMFQFFYQLIPLTVSPHQAQSCAPGNVGYTEIDIKVLFTLDGNDKGLRGHSKKICKVRFNIDVRKYFFFKSCY